MVIFHSYVSSPEGIYSPGQICSHASDFYGQFFLSVLMEQNGQIWWIIRLYSEPTIIKLLGSTHLSLFEDYPRAINRFRLFFCTALELFIDHFGVMGGLVFNIMLQNFKIVNHSGPFISFHIPSSEFQDSFSAMINIPSFHFVFYLIYSSLTSHSTDCRLGSTGSTMRFRRVASTQHHSAHGAHGPTPEFPLQPAAGWFLWHRGGDRWGPATERWEKLVSRMLEKLECTIFFWERCRDIYAFLTWYDMRLDYIYDYICMVSDYIVLYYIMHYIGHYVVLYYILLYFIFMVIVSYCLIVI